MSNREEAPFSVEELNRGWSDLLSSFMIAKLTLEKQNRALANEVARLRAENEALLEQIHRADIASATANVSRILNEKKEPAPVG